MAYEKTIWKDRNVENPYNFDCIKIDENGNEIADTKENMKIIATPGTIIESGTPIIAQNMNKLENGLEKCSADVDKANETLADKANNTDTERLTSAKDVTGAINELFTSANNGKNELEATIIGKGGTVSKAKNIATYDELDKGIISIPEAPRFGIDEPILEETIDEGHDFYDNDGYTTNYFTIPSCKSFYFAGCLETSVEERNVNHDTSGDSSITATIYLIFIATGTSIQLLRSSCDQTGGSNSYMHGLTLIQGADKSLLELHTSGEYYGGSGSPTLIKHNPDEKYDMSDGIKFEFTSSGRGGVVDRTAKMNGKAIAY